LRPTSIKNSNIYIYFFYFVKLFEMASKLNADCLMEIFEILELDQATTLKPCSLYPCILVNRQWCISAMRILWKNPWHFRKNLECVAYTIISTYISTFSKGSKELL